MSRLSKLVKSARVPEVFAGTITEEDREALLAVLERDTATIRAGESRASAIERLIAGLIGAAGETIPPWLALQAATEARKAAEAELARAQLAAEGEE